MKILALKQAISTYLNILLLMQDGPSHPTHFHFFSVDVNICRNIFMVPLHRRTHNGNKKLNYNHD